MPRLLLLLCCLLLPLTARADDYKSAFDRVMATNTLRCGYLIYAPYIIKDPNTGKLSGIFHDLVEELGHAASLKVEWTEEVGYESVFAGLDAGRYDAFCAGLWPSAVRARAGLFGAPMFYSTITAWVRSDDHRFDADLASANDPGVRVASIDGAMEDIIARADFPKASRVSLPELSPFSQNFVNIATGKADITFAQPSVGRAYVANNPGTLREISADRPLRVFGNSMVVGRGQLELKDFLDTGMQELLFGGRVDAILRKYEEGPGLYLRVSRPYQQP